MLVLDGTMGQENEGHMAKKAAVCCGLTLLKSSFFSSSIVVARSFVFEELCGKWMELYGGEG